ncbi:hypothetical protein, partial [Cupriavidus pauculus]
MDRVTLRRAWVAPLIFFQCYLAFSLLLFFEGPWPWDVDAPFSLAAYLIAAQLSISIGYWMSWRSVSKVVLTEAEREQEILQTIGVLKRALIVTLIMLIPTSLSRAGSLFPDFLEGLRDTGGVYNRNFARLADGNPFQIVEYLRILLSPYLVGLYPLTVVLWGRLSNKVRVVCCFAILFNLAIYIATGTNKGLADFVVTLPWLVYLGIKAGTLRFRVPRSVVVPVFILLFVGFLTFFAMGQAQREGGVGELGVLNTGDGLLYSNPLHPISVLVGDGGRIAFESIARYLGQGYYALSMAFHVDYSSTLGFGNSMFLARNADTLFGTDYFTVGSLPGQLEAQTGWSMMALWHSIYPWLASDFGFVGALVVLGGFAYVLGLSWGRALASASAPCVIMAFMMLVLFF